MTIAIGLLFRNGIIVAADTNEILDDGSKKQAVKVRATSTKRGCFAIAHATNDGNAAKTLVGHLIADIEGNDIESYDYLESLLADRMTQWAGAFHKPPSVQLILGVRLNHKGMALYFCEPPNSVVLDQRGYVAVGSGASVTDPLYKTLFPSVDAPARIRLTQVAYLMHRAKTDSAFCGGKTIAVIVPADVDGIPGWVARESMENAEDVVRTLDYLLKTTADAALPLPDESVESKGNWLGESAKYSAGLLRNLEFYVSGGAVDLTTRSEFEKSELAQ